MPPADPQQTRSHLFEAMVTEDDDAKRLELTQQYVAALKADVGSERRRRASAPRMALRPHGIEGWDGLDDVVVERPTMFRAEFMDDNDLWMCCYFPEPHDRISFQVWYDKKAKHLVLTETEMPAEWVDIDQERKNAHAQ